MTNPHELPLFKRIRKGDSSAFGAWCVQIEGRLLGYVTRLVKNRTEAEDIAQEALYRLYRMARAGRIRHDGAPRSLLFTIAHNLAVDVRRRAANVVPIDSRQAVSPSARLERALVREQIEKAIETLPESQRSALLLREFGALTYAEIAQTLEAKPETVKVWIYRARRRLADLLDRDGQYIEALRQPNKGEHRHDL